MAQQRARENADFRKVGRAKQKAKNGLGVDQNDHGDDGLDENWTYPNRHEEFSAPWWVQERCECRACCALKEASKQTDGNTQG